MFSFLEKIKKRGDNTNEININSDEKNNKAKTIALMGSERNVGCSFISLVLFNYINSQNIKTIILIDPEKKEKYNKIKKELNLQKIEIDINTNSEDYEKNYQIIIKDFGVLDRNRLNAAFVESDKKVLVTTSSIFHRNSINNILQYIKKTEDYRINVLFNKTSKNIFETWKKFFLEYNIKNTFHLDLISDISEYKESDVFMNSFRKEFFRNI